jgi:hypothetical protein
MTALAIVIGIALFVVGFVALLEHAWNRMGR